MFPFQYHEILFVLFLAAVGPLNAYETTELNRQLSHRLSLAELKRRGIIPSIPNEEIPPPKKPKVGQSRSTSCIGHLLLLCPFWLEQVCGPCRFLSEWLPRRPSKDQLLDQSMVFLRLSPAILLRLRLCYSSCFLLLQISWRSLLYMAFFFPKCLLILWSALLTLMEFPPSFTLLLIICASPTRLHCWVSFVFLVCVVHFSLSSTRCYCECCFFVSGDLGEVQMLKNSINFGDEVILARFHAHAIAGAFKSWFRELPDSLLPSTFYQRFIDAARAGESCFSIILLFLGVWISSVLLREQCFFESYCFIASEC